MSSSSDVLGHDAHGNPIYPGDQVLYTYRPAKRRMRGRVARAIDKADAPLRWHPYYWPGDWVLLSCEKQGPQMMPAQALLNLCADLTEDGHQGDCPF